MAIINATNLLLKALKSYVDGSRGGAVCLSTRKLARLAGLPYETKVKRVVFDFLTCVSVIYITVFGAPQIFVNNYRSRTVCFARIPLTKIVYAMLKHDSPCRNVRTIVKEVS